MSEFPPPGTYRIMFRGCTATILEYQTVLRGEPILDDTILDDTYRWDLEYVANDSELAKCVLKDRKGYGYLHVNSVENYQEVCRDGPQDWILRKTDDGYTISRVSIDGEYFWYLTGEGEPIIIADRSKGIQSWVFKRWH